jgi:RimJ/RimL family protein N-acetyltransferase
VIERLSLARAAAPLVVLADPSEHHWLAKRAGIGIGPGLQCLKVERQGRIVGMVGFDGQTRTSVAMHVAVDEPWALRALIKPAFGYAFYELGKRVAIAQVLGTNARSLKMVAGLGFREVCRGKDWVDHGVDMVIHEMRRADCKWLR